MSDGVIPLKVAVRCRPLVPKELNEGCQTCIEFVSGEPQVILGTNRSFTYDYAFSPEDLQPEVYETAVKPLIKHIFKGYNATVLAYGQTGSGKTFTMGGGYEASLKMDPIAMGVIPRILQEVFDGISDKETFEFTVKCSYLEIINEDLMDLFASSSQREGLVIREENGEIKLPGLKEVPVTSAEGTMKLLETGSQNRTTASTAMNSSSSRSHAIFSVLIEQKSKEDLNDIRKSKLQLVDLAGSERVKRTKAEGERFKEGVNINKGLLALGNVISALGDESQKKQYIPYRDSKLTRILQDSLGGNSHTLMIACISPADSNMEETLNTLRYADRARKIKNKPIVNIDPQRAENMRLKALVKDLQMQLINAGVLQDSTASSKDSFENKLAELSELKRKIESLEEENSRLTCELKRAIAQSTKMCEKAIQLEMKNDKLKMKLSKFEEEVGLDLDLLSSSINVDTNPEVKEQLDKLKDFTKKLKEPEPAEEESADGAIVGDDDENEDGDMLESPESREQSKQHVLRQAKMNQELQTLTKLLEQKEQLALQACKNGKNFDTMTEQAEGKIRQYEEQIASLHKEKDGLAQALEDARAGSAVNKVSESRRKRLQELEQQIGELRKKLVDHKKILKHKEQSDKQVSKLNTEIVTLKQQRVKLMKQMKEDADNFRKMKQQKDREVMQLQQKDRRRQFEIQKLQRENLKTQNVLHRKSEEAAAANRRLKEALAKQKKVLEERSQKFEKCDSASLGQRVRKWLSHELEMRVIVSEAKYHRESLVQDRKELAEQLKELKEKLDDNGPPAKKLAWMDDSGQKCETSFKEEEMKKKMAELEKQIKMRNVQICDLQQKIFDADQECKPKSIVENMHTMMEAKCGVKWLMEQAVSFKADNNRIRSDNAELKKNINTDGEDNEHMIEQLESELEKLKSSHHAEILNMQNSYESKLEEVLAFVKTEQSQEVVQKQAEIEKLLLEKDTMEKHLTKLMYKEKSIALMPDLTVDDAEQTSEARSPFLSPRPKFRGKSTARPANVDEDEDEEEEEEEGDDLWKDPDWVKTPVNPSKVETRRRRTDLFKQRKVERASNAQQALPKDRQSDGGQCKCKTNCVTNRCACRKNKSYCHKDCSCSKVCENQEPQVPESTTEDIPSAGSSVLNSTFEVQSGSPELEKKRSVLALLQCDESVRSSDEFMKPMTRKASSAELKQKSTADLKKHVSHGDLRKKSSTGDLKKKYSSEDSSESLLEGGVKKKRKLLNTTDSFFAPL